MIKKILLYLFFIIALGCSSYSNQLNNIRAPFNDMVDVDQFLWSATLDDISFLVYPINLSDHTAFANREGVIIRFNGWEIFQLIIPKIDTNIILNFSPDQVVSTGTYNYQMNCLPWEAESIGGSIKQNKHCYSDEIAANNYLFVNEQGETLEIHQFISNDLGYLNLKKL